MATSKIKGLDEQLLEGGGTGAGGFRSARGANEKRLEQRINDMSPKERASLDDIGKQFETLSPMAQRAQDKIAKVNATRGRPVSDKPKVTDCLGQRDYLKSEETLARKNRTAEEKAAEKAEKELTASRRQEALNNAKTEGVKTEYPYIEPTSKKAGGAVTASRRADGIAMRGKTRGKMC